MGEGFGRYIALIGGPVVALAALIAPFQSLVELSLPYLLILSLMGAFGVAELSAQQLAAWSSAPPNPVGFAPAPGRPQGKGIASIAILVVLCSVLAALVIVEVYFLALRITTTEVNGRPVTTFYAPVRPIERFEVKPKGVDLSTCAPANASPPVAAALALQQSAWFGTNPAAVLSIDKFGMPQAFSLDCGPSGHYLPPSMKGGDTLVLDDGQMRFVDFALVLIGGLIWSFAAWRWRSLRR